MSTVIALQNRWSRLKELAPLAIRWGPLMLALVATLCVYFPLTRVYFWGDDFTHFVFVADKGALQFYLLVLSGHLYLVRNIFFLGPYLLFGLHPEPYGWITLAVHLANVALFYRIVLNLCGEEIAAGLGAACWGSCPTISWTAADYATSGPLYAAAFSLMALALLTRPALHEVPTRTAIISAVLVWMAACSSGVGLAVSMVFPVVVLFLANGAYRRRGAAIAFVALPLVVYATYRGTIWLYRQKYGMDSLLLINLRVGDPDVRKEVLKRVLMIPARLAQLVSASLAAITWPAGTLLKKLSPDSGQVTFVGEILAAILLFSGLFLATAKLRRALLGLGVLVVAPFAAMAYGRFGDFSKIARYQYFGSMIVAMILTIGIAQIAAELRVRRALPAILFVVGWITTYAAFVRSRWHVEDHSECRDGVAFALDRIDSAIDQAPPGHDVDLPVEDIPGCWMWPDMHRSAGLFVITHPNNTVRGHRVRFWTTRQDMKVLAANAPHPRFATLLFERAD